MDHLLVNLHLAGQREPILCIPHGAGGLMGPKQAEHLAARIERANDGNDGAVYLHLVWHARGSVSTDANLRGASFSVASPADIERWEKRCTAHRASADFERNPATDGLLVLRDAVAMVDSLDRCGLPGFTPTALRTRYLAEAGDIRWNGIRLEILADRAIRDGMVLHSVSPSGGLHDVGLTPDEFAVTIRQGYHALAVDPYDHEGNLRANLDQRILAAHRPVASTCSGGGCIPGKRRPA